MPKRHDYDACEYDGDRACAVEAFLDVLGGRWKGMILFHLLTGTKRFGGLKKLLPSVTQRMLTAQLREMEKDQIVMRKVYAEVPPRVEYSLTPMGQKLTPIVHLMSEWGDRYMTRYSAEKAGAKPPVLAPAAARDKATRRIPSNPAHPPARSVRRA